MSKAAVIALLSLLVVCVRHLPAVHSGAGAAPLSSCCLRRYPLSARWDCPPALRPGLCVASKLVLIFTMYIGRVGAFTLLSVCGSTGPTPASRYTEETITIG